jgi:hypothetical protein
MTNQPRPWLAPVRQLAAILLLSACGGDSLSPDVVTHLPDGDGTGSAASGSYVVEVYTSGCAGRCTVSSQSVCDIGQRRNGTLVVTQQGGHLRVEPQETDLVLTRLDGGIWKDGHFDVGGLATQLGGAVVITARATGSIDAGGHFSGQAHAHADGQVEDEHLDCTAAFEISAP